MSLTSHGGRQATKGPCRLITTISWPNYYLLKSIQAKLMAGKFQRRGRWDSGDLETSLRNAHDESCVLNVPCCQRFNGVFMALPQFWFLADTTDRQTDRRAGFLHEILSLPSTHTLLPFFPARDNYVVIPKAIIALLGHFMYILIAPARYSTTLCGPLTMSDEPLRYYFTRKC